MMSEKFCLKWNDFQQNLNQTFSCLRNETEFSDVTLFCDDQRQLNAHKVVLSSCSEYFKSILKSNKNSHPILCMIDLNYDDLSNILDYIYHGEVQLYQDQLDRFLNIAQKLKVDGLLSNKLSDDSTHEENMEENTAIVMQTKETKEFVNKNQTPRLNENQTPIVNKNQNHKIAAFSMPHDISNEDLDKKIMEYVGNTENGQLMCTFCGKVQDGKKHLGVFKLHIETHLSGISYTCEICQKHFRSRNSLRVHRSQSHK